MRCGVCGAVCAVWCGECPGWGRGSRGKGEERAQGMPFRGSALAQGRGMIQSRCTLHGTRCRYGAATTLGPRPSPPGSWSGRPGRLSLPAPLTTLLGGRALSTLATPQLFGLAPNRAAGPAEESACPPELQGKFPRSPDRNDPMNRKHPSGSVRSRLGASAAGTARAHAVRRSILPRRPPVTPADPGGGSPARDPGAPRSPLCGHQTKRGRGRGTRCRLTSGPRSPGLAAGRRAASRPAERRGALFGESARGACPAAGGCRLPSPAAGWQLRAGSAPCASGDAPRPAAAAPPGSRRGESSGPRAASSSGSGSAARFRPSLHAWPLLPGPPPAPGLRAPPRPGTWRLRTPSQAPPLVPLPTDSSARSRRAERRRGQPFARYA